MLNTSNSTENNETEGILMKVYLHCRLARYMASNPVRAAFIVHISGFWSLFLGNLLNHSLLFSSPRAGFGGRP